MRRALITALRLLGSIALLYVLWRFAGGRRLLTQLLAIPLDRTLGLALLAVPFVATKIVRWHWLVRLHVRDYPLSMAARSLLVGLAAGVLTPARVGEAARLAYVPGGRLAVLAGLLVVDRAFEVIGVGLWAIPGIVLFAHATVWSLVGFGAMALAGFLLRGRAKRYATGLRSRLAGSCRFPPLAEAALMGLLPAVIAYGTVILQSAWFIHGYSRSPLWSALACSPLVALATATPFTLSGLGAREGVAAVTFGHFGVPRPVAIGLGFTLFVCNTLIPGLLGSLCSCVWPGRWKGQTKQQQETSAGGQALAR